MKRYTAQKSLMILSLMLVMIIGLAACGAGKPKEADLIQTATTFFHENAEAYAKQASGDATLVNESWSEDPMFEDIAAISSMGGVAPYQGTAKDALRLIEQPLTSTWPDKHIAEKLCAALNEKGDIVLAWVELIQTFPDEEGREAIRCMSAISWEPEIALMRLNDLRLDMQLPPISLDGNEMVDEIPVPDAEEVPSQNSNIDNPEDMTESEQEAYNTIQEEDGVAEENSDSSEE